MPAQLKENRALARQRLEALAWQATPPESRGPSGSRREVREAGRLVPLNGMTDFQLRRYIGPDVLKEAGDMQRNGRGIYSDTAAQEDDYVIHSHRSRYYADHVDRGGTHQTIGTTRGFASVEEVIQAIRKDARTRGSQSGIIFRQEGDELAQIGHADPRHELPGHRRNSRDGHPRPKFQIGDRVEDLEGQRNGEIAYVGSYNGPGYGWQYKMKHDDPSWGRKFINEIDLRHEHRPNTSRREEPDEHAARELSLYIENDYNLVGAPNSIGKSIEKNLLAKIRKGTFDLKRSEDAFMYLMEAGAKKYAAEFGDGAQTWAKLFNKPTRELIAHEFASTFYEENKGR